MRRPGPLWTMLVPMKYALLFSLALTGSCVLTSAETPGQLREGVLRDTSTAPFGTLGVELAVEVDPGDRQAVPLRLEYGYGEATAVFLDVAAYEKVELAGNDGEGFGDLGLGLRHRFLENDVGTTAALEGRVTLPTGNENEGTGSGSVDLYAAAVLSQAFEEVLLSGWLELGVLGDALDTGTDMQRTVGVAGAMNLGESVIGFAALEREFRDDFQPALGKLGVAWRTSSSMTIDVGMAVGLNSEAPDASFFVGFSSNLGPLGPRGPYRDPESYSSGSQP